MLSKNCRVVGLLLVGIACGAALDRLFFSNERMALAQTSRPVADPQSLAVELETIKGKLPDQSHAMEDVSHHFSNLWFAAQKENWPLATFYLDETRSHLRWAVRIIPKRKDNEGREIDLEAILQAFENSPWKQMQDAIAAKDKSEFETKYRFALETCYACHKAADKPYIRPQIPTQPENPIINFDPGADWPK